MPVHPRYETGRPTCPGKDYFRLPGAIAVCPGPLSLDRIRGAVSGCDNRPSDGHGLVMDETNVLESVRETGREGSPAAFDLVASKLRCPPTRPGTVA
jgi:hypothetical protein